MMKAKRKFFIPVASTVFSGMVMWLVGGLYHNLVLPAVNEQKHPHHEGLGITLIAYLILGALMTYLYVHSKDTINSARKGIRIGIIVGILWVLPHGITMAAVHGSSISYELFNALYHVIEQGSGGLMIYATFRCTAKKTKR